jgi:uncharacterized protein YjeT (DUF2065 family)
VNIALRKFHVVDCCGPPAEQRLAVRATPGFLAGFNYNETMFGLLIALCIVVALSGLACIIFPKVMAPWTTWKARMNLAFYAENSEDIKIKPNLDMVRLTGAFTLIAGIIFAIVVWSTMRPIDPTLLTGEPRIEGDAVVGNTLTGDIGSINSPHNDMSVAQFGDYEWGDWSDYYGQGYLAWFVDGQNVTAAGFCDGSVGSGTVWMDGSCAPDYYLGDLDLTEEYVGKNVKLCFIIEYGGFKFNGTPDKTMSCTPDLIVTKKVRASLLMTTARPSVVKTYAITCL